MGIFDEPVDLDARYPSQMSMIRLECKHKGYNDGYAQALKDLNSIKLYDGADWKGNTVYYCGRCGPAKCQWDSEDDAPIRCPICGQKLKEN